jgi:hypothetical protein
MMNFQEQHVIGTLVSISSQVQSLWRFFLINQWILAPVLKSRAPQPKIANMEGSDLIYQSKATDMKDLFVGFLVSAI